MSSSREELHDELMAMLAAGRELPGDTHEQLVESFLARTGAESLGMQGRNRLHALYHDIVPVGLPAVAGIALAHGLTLLIIGKWMLEGVMYLSPYSSVYWPAWTMLGVIWIVEVLVTLATMSLLRHPAEERTESGVRRRKVQRT